MSCAHKGTERQPVICVNAPSPHRPWLPSVMRSPVALPPSSHGMEQRDVAATPPSGPMHPARSTSRGTRCAPSGCSQRHAAKQAASVRGLLHFKGFDFRKCRSEKRNGPSLGGNEGGAGAVLYASVISSRHRPQRRAVLLVPAQSPVFETARVLLCLCDARHSGRECIRVTPAITD